ncbi:universal stress protein [Kriegella aquimaris]|uniref:Nucleotide-binding universal stress protein, UspA family n=1 Tax=Kriegella aquimaris TaxID=192904 RepID=A0A1G9JI50_9FLAO|nr:universal stress protein [Kriegella aquimaris]SDL36784.1 Nucleotide-binding universal stress protein, UspA family [Kriegella aquimaris]
MDKLSTILVPFDFSDAAKKALEYAVAFVGRYDDIKIVLAYISGHSNFKLLPENFKKIEEKYRAVLKNELKWEIQDGSLTQTLLEIRKTEKVDLIIMGTLGADKQRGREQTHTSRLVLASECPVLVVPHNYKYSNLNNIALVLGRKEIDDSKVLSTLLKVALKFNAKVHVLTIENQPTIYGYSAAEEKNENSVEYYLGNFYKERIFIKNKDVLEGILTYAIKNDIDLVTIVPRNHMKHGKPSEGQLTHLLALHSKLPILALD